MYRGELDEDNNPHGRGVCKYPKSLFDGCWHHGERLNGLYIDSNGSSIDG